MLRLTQYGSGYLRLNNISHQSSEYQNQKEEDQCQASHSFTCKYSVLHIQKTRLPFKNLQPEHQCHTQSSNSSSLLSSDIHPGVKCPIFLLVQNLSELLSKSDRYTALPFRCVCFLSPIATLFRDFSGYNACASNPRGFDLWSGN